MGADWGARAETVAAEVLGAHGLLQNYCSCDKHLGWRQSQTERRAAHRAHVAAEMAAALAPVIAAAQAEAWDEGFSRGFYDVLAQAGDRDASESPAENPYEAKP